MIEAVRRVRTGPAVFVLYRFEEDGVAVEIEVLVPMYEMPQLGLGRDATFFQHTTPSTLRTVWLGEAGHGNVTRRIRRVDVGRIGG